jgi:hypothetical protein
MRRRERMATLASKTASVKGPEYSKLEPGFGPPLQPRIHSANGPSLTRGSVFAGSVGAFAHLHLGDDAHGVVVETAQHRGLAAKEERAGLRRQVASQLQLDGQRRDDTTVRPGVFDRGHGAACWEMIGHDGGEGTGDFAGAGRHGFDRGRGAEVQRPVGTVHDVTGDVAERARAKVPPTAPFPRQVGGIVVALLGGAQPGVPVQRLRHHRHELRVVGWIERADRLAPRRIERTIGPADHLAHLAEHAGGDPLLEQTTALAGVALVAHLGDDLFLARHPGQAHAPPRPCATTAFPRRHVCPASWRPWPRGSAM